MEVALCSETLRHLECHQGLRGSRIQLRGNAREFGREEQLCGLSAQWHWQPNGCATAQQRSMQSRYQKCPHAWAAVYDALNRVGVDLGADGTRSIGISRSGCAVNSRVRTRPATKSYQKCPHAWAAVYDALNRVGVDSPSRAVMYNTHTSCLAKCTWR